MGLCTSVSGGTQDLGRDAAAEKERLDALENARKVKLLLLGPGESGKSTLFHQFRQLYGNPIKIDERKARRIAVHENTIQSIKALVRAARELGLVLGSPEKAEAVEALNYEEPLTTEQAWVISAVWADPAVQRAFAERARFQVPDGARVFLDDLTRISAPDYVPTIDDVLHARVRTTGVRKERFADRNADGRIERQFEVYDVGGQKSERRKWLVVFSDVAAILFVVALNEYDQRMYEDEETNRMVDALALFRDTCANASFRKTDPTTGKTTYTPIMLFLNKLDLFEEKIKTVDIRQPAAEGGQTDLFMDYSGGQDPEAGKEYFADLFKKEAHSPDQPIHIYFTTAVSKDNVDDVFGTCKPIVLERIVENL